MEQDIFITAEDIENVSEEDMDRLKDLVEEYQSILNQHGRELDEILRKINNSKVYEEFGVEVIVDREYYYSVNEKENES